MSWFRKPKQKLVAQRRPIVIQSLFMRINGMPPPAAEIDAFCQRLQEIIRDGGMISLVQVYTVARRPAESYVTSLRHDEVDWIRDQVRQQTDLPADSYYGNDQV